MTKKIIALLLAFFATANANAEEPLPYEAMPQGIVSRETYEAVLKQCAKDPFEPINGCYFHWVASFYTIAVQGAEIIKLQEQVKQLTPVITDFLWKPVSERDGKVAVLASMEGVDIHIVSADGTRTERLTDTGASNGYGTTGRSRYTCQQWGERALLYFEKAGLRVPIFSKHRYPWVTIDDACSRIEGHDN